jgi:FKBP-type peptidyl-prolyl cis-trans isomerase FkpA
MWRYVEAAALALCAIPTLIYGIWVITKSRLPSWVTGIWRWPLGDNLSADVANLQGWACVLVGAGALTALPAVPLGLEAPFTARAALALSILLLFIGVAAFVRSVAHSYRDPAPPHRQTVLAAGLVAGLALGALITSGIYDLFPSAPSSPPTSTTTHQDGLRWSDIQLGAGMAAVAGRVMRIRYAIWLADGTLVDSTPNDGATFNFTLGKGEVIKGLDEGMIGMRVGGIRWLSIPPNLAYGATGASSLTGPRIPPNATLLMVVTLKAIDP